MELIGVQFMDFKGQDGDRIAGAKLYCLGDDVPAGKGMGRSCESVFATSEKCPKVPPIGSHVEFVYNRYGRLQRVDIID